MVPLSPLYICLKKQNVMEKISKLIRCAAKRWAEKRKNTDSPEQKTVETPERIETQVEKTTTQTVQNITKNLIFPLQETGNIVHKAVYCVIFFARDYYKIHFDTEQIRALREHLTCWEMTHNHTGRQRIFCISPPS